MNTERIKEIHLKTAHPNSISVQQALLQVWNECEQENNIKLAEKDKEIERLKFMIDNNLTEEDMANDNKPPQEI